MVKILLVLRRASIEDAFGIAECYRSDYLGIDEVLSRFPDTPENLYRFGGVWMHGDSCAEHIELFRKYGGEILVAEVDGKVVGHIEVIPDFSRDLGEYLYISVLMVHRRYRQRGIGTKLVGMAEDYARERGLRCVVVNSEEQSVGFYEKLGFKIRELWYSIYLRGKPMEFNFSTVETDRAAAEILGKKYDLLVGRFHGSRAVLFEFLNRYRSLEKMDISHMFYQANVGDGGVLIGIRKSQDIPNVAWCWSRKYVNLDKALDAIRSIAHILSISKILTCVPNKGIGLELVETLTWMSKTV